MLENSYKLVIEHKKCMIYDKNNVNRLLTTIPISPNGLFLLIFSIRYYKNVAHMVIKKKE